MKQLFSFLLVLSLWGPGHLFAQAVDPTRAALDNVFANIDKSQVPTGFLAEYALPLVPLDVFNGTLADSSRTTPDGFRFIYGTIYSARIYGANSLPTLSDLNARIAAAEAAAGTAIPVMTQRIYYSTVQANAFSANLLSLQNGQVFDVAGRTQSPYEGHMVFAVAPARNYSATGNVSFVFPYSLFIQSGGAPVGSVAVDFGDGRGYVPDPNYTQPLATSYAKAGTYRVKVRVGYYDGNSYESQFDLEVAAPGGFAARPTAGDYSIPFAPIAGVRAGGTAYVHLATNHTQLTKPLIVAEGYDQHFIAPLIQKDNYSSTQFLDEINITNGFNFRNALENIGSYDIVFIDYDNGTDDILANAGLFEAVLNRVNADKQGPEQNVVMGISMGGLIARYQLADMVKAGRPTQTRLLILQDSPQRGANVPLGIQALTRQAVVDLGPFTTADLSKTLAQANLLFDQPATQQLVLYQATDGTGGFAANTFVEGPYRTKVTFSPGQAPPYQVIAASQGSQCGNGLFAPYTELVRGDGKFFLSPLPWIIRSSYNAQVIVNALPDNGQANRVSTLQIYSLVRLFGLITIRNDFVRKDYSCPAGLLPLDGAPGGTEPIANTPGNLIKGTNFSVLPFFQLSVSYSAVDKFSFIPVPSALDIADFTPTTLYGKYVRGAASTSYSRVNDFLAQEQFTRGAGPFFNEAHTVFTPRNSEWMFSQMQGTPPPCSAADAECTIPRSITGPDAICPNNSATYAVSNPPAGLVFTWSSSNTAIATIDPSTGIATSVGNGVVTFTATANSSCGSITLSKQVTIGTPTPSITAQLVSGPGEPTDIEFTATTFPGANITYNWYANNVFRETTSSNVWRYYFQCNRTNTITCSLSTCNNTSAQSNAITEKGSCIRTAATYSFAPNPAATELVVQEEPTAARTTATAPFEAHLYNGFGQVVANGRSQQGTIRLNVRHLPDGLYTLRAGAGATALNEHIQIMR